MSTSTVYSDESNNFIFFNWPTSLQNIVVTEQFETLLNEKIRNEKSRELQVVHGGVLFKKKQLFTIDTDLDMSFESDPMTKLKRFAHRNKLRLVDVFRQLDKDQSNTLSEAEFLRCIEVRIFFSSETQPGATNINIVVRTSFAFDQPP